MRKVSFVIAGIAALAIAVPATAVTVYDPTPNGAFSDGTNQGYVQIDTDGHAIRACNENPGTPAGDDLTGYAWVSQNGESTTPSYGNANIGAGDADGEDDGDPTNGNEAHDCPVPAS